MIGEDGAQTEKETNDACFLSNTESRLDNTHKHRHTDRYVYVRM